MAVDTLSNYTGFLSPHDAGPIFQDAQRVSVFQKLIRQVPLAVSGEAIPVITNRPTANWVGEGKRKPSTSMGLAKLTMKPQKLAAIAVYSAEVIRANPGGINGLIRPALAEAFGKAFDYAVGFGLGGDGTGTGPFEHHMSEADKSVQLSNMGAVSGRDLSSAMSLMVADHKRLTGWALDSQMEPMFWGATDQNQRPLWADFPTDQAASVLQQQGVGVARAGQLLGRPAAMGEGIASPDGATLGFFGDFTRAAWGTVGGISYRVSTDGTVTLDGQLVSLFENNLVALLAEAEYGFVMESPDYFGRIVAAG